MRKLEPLIARFVEDVLSAIRRASPQEIHELLSTAQPTQPGQDRAPRPVKRRQSNPKYKRSLASNGSSVGAAAEGRPATEITDPEWLLSSRNGHDSGLVAKASPHEPHDPELHETPSTPAAPGADFSSRAPSEPEEAGPESAVVSSMRLAAGESVARLSAAGLVVRRRRQ